MSVSSTEKAVLFLLYVDWPNYPDMLRLWGLSLWEFSSEFGTGVYGSLRTWIGLKLPAWNDFDAIIEVEIRWLVVCKVITIIIINLFEQFTAINNEKYTEITKIYQTVACHTDPTI